MLDLWEGELAFAKIDGEVVWTKNGDGKMLKGQKSINVCGNTYPDPKFGM